MKIAKTFFLVLFITLINVSSVLAGPNPPAPTARAAAGPPPPPDSPIDQNLIILLVVAVFFGMYTIYKYNLIKKASI
ncbi:hypothetical protein IRZ71_13255 [Flavobacterium sp. ANB]|uniref:hypothetical protein n=1 Tax=unclassified Flavobacterium TaxID=196869 RepID=UPI0012B9C363|nr:MULTISPECIES: hypothetical protein [unclassified Flavobacterium]MBF4517325.1 hypothetical protein [Flavobacterium sp. ANB]MTD70702.1 hypothetical protein [Flavobacterium sp. LC2016-13]